MDSSPPSPPPPSPPPSVPAPPDPGAYGPAPGPYGHGYGQGYGYGFPPPVPPVPPVNGFAIASLVTGILCFLPGVGLILGAVGLVQIKKRRERGKGMAVTGTALSSVGLVLALLLAVTGAAKDFADGFREGVETAARGAWGDLQAGDCYNPVGQAEDGRTEDETYQEIVVVPCDEMHTSEIFAVVPVTEFNTWPGSAAMDLHALEVCEEAQAEYTLDMWAVPGYVEMFYSGPGVVDWKNGERTVYCELVDESGRHDAVLRSEASEYGEDQVVFLRGVNAVELVTWRGPEDPTADLEAGREWATDLHIALEGQLSRLRGHDFAAKAADPVKDFAYDLRMASDSWRKAGEATSQEDFDVESGRGWTSLELESQIPIREALGLGTEPPKWWTDMEDDASV